MIYFARPIGHDGPIKIGCSNSPLERVANLAIWSPFALELFLTIPGDVRLERRIHSRFKAHHSHHEWFAASPELVGFIQALANGQPIRELIDMDGPLPAFRARKKSAAYTEERRRQLSYSARIRLAFKPLMGKRRHTPVDVNQIMERWVAATRSIKYRRDVEPAIPSAEDLKRLELVIAHPTLYAVSADQAWPTLELVA